MSVPRSISMLDDEIHNSSWEIEENLHPELLRKVWACSNYHIPDGPSPDGILTSPSLLMKTQSWAPVYWQLLAFRQPLRLGQLLTILLTLFGPYDVVKAMQYPCQQHTYYNWHNSEVSMGPVHRWHTNSWSVLHIYVCIYMFSVYMCIYIFI